MNTIEQTETQIANVKSEENAKLYFAQIKKALIEGTEHPYQIGYRFKILKHDLYKVAAEVFKTTIEEVQALYESEHSMKAYEYDKAKLSKGKLGNLKQEIENEMGLDWVEKL